jgi:hypothetical protein
MMSYEGIKHLAGYYATKKLHSSRSMKYKYKSNVMLQSLIETYRKQIVFGYLPSFNNHKIQSRNRIIFYV